MAIPACGDDEDNSITIGSTAQPAYGVPATETQDPTLDPTTDTGDTTGGTEDESGSSTGDGEAGSTSLEPDYGVPTTGVSP